MSKSSGVWTSGLRAWKRLGGWHDADPGARSGDTYDGAAALEALDDIGHVRHLLDQVELVAVRTARRHGKSWAEIATRLGVTRQSAWERWRDLDDGPQESDPRPEGPAVGADVSGGALERAARELRRQATVTVPKVIGLGWDDAIQALRDKRLVGVGPDPDGPPLAAIGWPFGVVTDQSPESGAKVPPGSPVTLWVGRGGGSAGVREPRRPKPDPKVAHEERFEPSDEAAG